MNELKLKRKPFHAPESRLGVKADIAHIIVIEALQLFRKRPVRSLIRRGGQILRFIFEGVKIEAGTLILRDTIKRRAEKHNWEKTVFIHVREHIQSMFKCTKKNSEPVN
jgi:hypothetical protein